MGNNFDRQKIILILVIAVLLTALITLLITMPQTQRTAGPDQKIASVPTEIKTPQEASTLEKDTSSVLKEVSEAVTGIDSSLPDV